MYNMHYAHHFMVEVLKVSYGNYMELLMLPRDFGGLSKHILQDGCNGAAFSNDFLTEPAKYVRVKDGGLKK